MGGAASKKKERVLPLDSSIGTYNEIINEKCTMTRLDAENGSKEFDIIGTNYDYKLKYCYVSQRGYYPQSLNKANQDSYSIQESWYGNESIHMFGIYDGHGEYGDFCSHFAAIQTPLHFHKELDDNGGLDGINDIQKKYAAAFVTANEALHFSPIDDTLSGTTAITVFVQGDRLLVANVGDSRAIIASDINGSLKFSPLSIDQTPFRKDERTRLKKRGAKIMTMDQIEGAEAIHENWGDGETGNEIGEGDPPRVWDKSLQMPGCAFTRSIGDSVAEAIGVFAEPEILAWDIKPNDKFVIIASDGVFEFLTSQAVVDMVAGFADPLTAAKHVVSEAYRLWLLYDDRTDDISIIIINFSDIKKKSTGRESPNQNEIRKASDMDYHKFVNKPIRGSVRRKDRKKKVIVEQQEEFDIKDVDFTSSATEKTPAELTRITDLINSNFMFKKLTPEQKELLYKVMTFKEVKKDEIVINEGEAGTEMFIIDYGQYDVYKKDDKGQLVLVFTYTPPGAFGELSLIYGEPRAATIKAKTDGKLWCLGRKVFKAIMTSQTKFVNPLAYLKSMPIISDCPKTQLQRLGELSTEIVVPIGEKIVDRNSQPKYELYIIVSGSVQINLVSEESSIREANSYFAAFEIGTGRKCVESVISKSETKLLVIPRKALTSVLGNDIIIALTAALNAKNFRYNFTLQESIFNNDVPAKVNPKDYKLKNPTVLIGDFAYIAAYQNTTTTKNITSVKIVSKGRANKSKSDISLVREKKYLMALSKLKDNSNDTFITTAIGTYHNDKISMLFYDDHYVSDLSFLIYQTDIPAITKQYYSCCIYSGIKYLHGKGLFHRFINAENIYITSKGVAKVGGLIYTKEMSGKKSYTICGEAEYFAPEIILQQGYNYSVDIWAYGILLYELFEGKLPFGQENTDEVQLYKLITSYQGNLEFTIQEKAATSLVKSLLNPSSNERLGFKSVKEIMDHKFFKGMNWDNLLNSGKEASSFPSIDESSLFIHNDQDIVSLPLYDNF